MANSGLNRIKMLINSGLIGTRNLAPFNERDGKSWLAKCGLYELVVVSTGEIPCGAV
jgi:hypothetical protein